MDSPSHSRPYRSHKVPACNVCRRRKIACYIDDPNQPCRFCRQRRFQCTFSQTKHQSSRALGTGETASLEPQAEQGGQRDARDLFTSPNESSTLILNPSMAEDIDVLERYLTSHIPLGKSASRLYNRVSHASGESIMYLTLPQRRERLRKTGKPPGRQQREIMEEVLRPFKEDVIKLYFDNIHACFPILDSATFWELWRKDPERISSTLMCNIYACALVFWNNSESLRSHPCPDPSFAWNQAVEAEKEDFVAPSMTSVHSALIDLNGRPVALVMTNVVNVGRIITLAHSLGLHRDPTTWRATDAEKGLRIRLWWGVLIHDHWSSLAHGIPPNIHRANYDVPLPTFDCLAKAGISEGSERATASFLHLCSLTQILGDILPLVYALNPNQEDMWKSIRRIECALDDWRDALPDFLHVSEVNSTIGANGTSSLIFCFLSVKVLLGRVAFRATLLYRSHSMMEAKEYRLASLRNSASNLAEFVTNLQEANLREFWLSYTAHLLVSVTTILLRCTVESNSLNVKRECADRLVKLIERLQIARDSSSWDLADFCLQRCKEPVERIATAIDVLSSETNLTAKEITIPGAAVNAERTGNGNDLASSVPTDDLLLPLDPLDFPWETLWYDLEGPWSTTV